MLFEKGKKAFVVIGSVLLPLTTAGALFFGSSDLLKPSKADGTSIVLDENLQPTLDGSGDGQLLDQKGVKWEYHNAASYPSGHVSIGHQGYFGVSSSTDYGITEILSVTVDFESTDNELWLLKSTDGINWHEEGLLESDTPSTGANNWRYIRFYNWSDDNTSIDINSVTISYGCSGISATDDVDLATIDNVISVTSNLTYQTDTVNVSPLGDSTQAITFTKTNTSGTEITLSLGRDYTIGEIKEKKIEFDLKASSVNYGKTFQLIGDSYSTPKINSNENSGYKIRNIQDDWYHVDVPVSCLVSTNSGYDKKDIPASNIESKKVNRIKINQGNCTIDNLRIGSDSCELGNFNKPEGTGQGQYQPVVGEFFWIKTSWVGILHPELCSMSFSDNTLARHIPVTDPNLKNGSPFYVELLAAGSVTVTVNVVCGYNRRAQTIQKTITIQ